MDAEPSLGTHFSQDLLEGQIYPLVISTSKNLFEKNCFEDSPTIWANLSRPTKGWNISRA